MYTNYQLVFNAARVSGNRVFGKRFFAKDQDEADKIVKKMVASMIGDKVLRHLDWSIVKNDDEYHSWMWVMEGVPKECLPKELKLTWMGGKIFFWAKENVPLYRGKGLETREGYDKYVKIPKKWVKVNSLETEYYGPKVQVSGGYYHRNKRDCDIYYIGGSTYAKVTRDVVDIQGGPCIVEEQIEYFNK